VFVFAWSLRFCGACRRFADSTLIQSVGDWLADLKLSRYENTLIANGYDDMDFMVRRGFHSFVQVVVNCYS